MSVDHRAKVERSAVDHLADCLRDEAEKVDAHMHAVASAQSSYQALALAKERTALARAALDKLLTRRS